MENLIKQHINNHSKIINNNFEDISFCIKKIAIEIKKTLKKKKTIFFAGNGGSAADCEHLAGELVGRYKKNRKPYNAISLTTDTSVITCIANDFGYEKIFERQLESIGNKKDILIAISTSGKSKNILNAIEVAKKKELKIIFLTSNLFKKNITKCDIVIKSPAYRVDRIQEMHIAIGHIICEMIEKNFK